MIAIQNVLKVSVLALTVAAFATSCDKRQDAKLTLDNDVAIVNPVTTTDTIYGNFANPTGPASGYGVLYLNLSVTPIGISSVQDSSHDVKLYLTNNSFIAGVGGYSVKYIRNTSISSFSSLIPANFATAPTPDSIGRSTTVAPAVPNGWYTYTPPNNLTLVTSFYILATSPTEQDYAIRFTYSGGDGTATSNRGKYIIQYGPIN